MFIVGHVCVHGTMVEVNVSYNSGHRYNWCSQPYIVNIGAGNLILCSCLTYWKYLCTWKICFLINPNLVY